MYKRKLLTAACFAGILICGACGLMFAPTPTPPRKTLFVGIHTVRIEVADKSANPQLDTVSLRDALVREINAQRGKIRLEAISAGDADCVLSLVVLDEDGREVWTDPKQDAAFWQFQAKFAVNLTGKQGQILWSLPWPTSHQFEFRDIQKNNITPGWGDPGLRKQLSFTWASALVNWLVYQ
jgi:hypothetical protein